MKIAKSLLTRSAEAGTDPMLALLEWRNTPSEGFETSPAQRLMSRSTKTPLQVTTRGLEPEINPATHEQLEKQRMKQKKTYDKNARELPAIDNNQTVRVRPTILGDDAWKKGRVIR